MRKIFANVLSFDSQNINTLHARNYSNVTINVTIKVRFHCALML